MEIIPNWHPIFVHFTVALLSVSVCLFLICGFVKREPFRGQCRVVAYWNLWIGAGITLVTVSTGFYAFNTVAHDDPSHLAMTDHRNWALVTASAFLALTAWSVWQYRAKKSLNPVFLFSMAIALLLLLSTAWHGGELVFRHGLGVKSLPQVESSTGDGHAHSHGPASEPRNTEDGMENDGKQDTHDDGHDHDH